MVIHECTEPLPVGRKAGKRWAYTPGEGPQEPPGSHRPFCPIPEAPPPGGSYLGYSVRGAHSFPSGKQNKGMALSSRSSSSCWPRSRFSRCKDRKGDALMVHGGAAGEGRRQGQQDRAGGGAGRRAGFF